MKGKFPNLTKINLSSKVNRMPSVERVSTNSTIIRIFFTEFIRVILVNKII